MKQRRENVQIKRTLKEERSCEISEAFCKGNKYCAFVWESRARTRGMVAVNGNRLVFDIRSSGLGTKSFGVQHL